MCLVTYLPTDYGFILSSNRDEQPERSADLIMNEKIGQSHVVFPKDPIGGSWIFSSKEGKHIVLLNGAFEKHERRNNYKMSRGLVIKACYEYKSTALWLEQFDFNNIEPFTLIINEEDAFFEFRWDEKIKHIRNLSRDKVYTWSSSTLYDPEMINAREAFFTKFTEDKSGFTLEEAKALHSADTGLPRSYDYLMARGDIVRTISTTHIIGAKDKATQFVHYNRETKTKTVIAI